MVSSAPGESIRTTAAYLLHFVSLGVGEWVEWVHINGPCAREAMARESAERMPAVFISSLSLSFPELILFK